MQVRDSIVQSKMRSYPDDVHKFQAQVYTCRLFAVCDRPDVNALTDMINTSQSSIYMPTCSQTPDRSKCSIQRHIRNRGS